MLTRIDQWIDATNEKYFSQRTSCAQFTHVFAGSFKPEFLQQAYFVIVDDIPRPEIPELREMGFGDYLNRDFTGICYKDIYYIKRGHEQDLYRHFHELVHVAQWQILGALPFINRYMTELQLYGYDNAPMERIAYNLADRFDKGAPALDIPSITKRLLEMQIDG